METHTPQELQLAGLTSATVPAAWTIFCDSRVTAREAAALLWAMDSSMGLG